MIKLLASKAEEVGAKIILRHQFEGFSHVGRKIVARVRNCKTEEPIPILTDILVGADGASSTVAYALSYNGHYPTTLLQARVVRSGGEAPDTCQVWFDSKYTRYFFWLIPESVEFTTVGLIADSDLQARTSLGIFWEKRGLNPLEFQEARVPLYRFNWMEKGRIWDRGVFLIGDAASQVKVTTVGGVVSGLYGAKALASALLNGGDYQKELRNLKLELDLHLLVRNVLNRFNNEDYDRLLDTLDWRIKDILQKRNRDELRSFFLKMILTEPQFLRLGLKAFLRSIYRRS